MNLLVGGFVWDVFYCCGVGFNILKIVFCGLDNMVNWFIDGMLVGFVMIWLFVVVVLVVVVLVLFIVK